MSGIYIPLVMIPRFTSYVGDGDYRSVLLDVSEYAAFVLSVWRGPLVKGVGTGAGLSLTFEDSDDAEVWTTVSGTSAIVTADASSVVSAELTKRWLRVRLELTEDSTDHAVALTCWAMGHLVRREQA